MPPAHLSSCLCGICLNALQYFPVENLISVMLVCSQAYCCIILWQQNDGKKMTGGKYSQQILTHSLSFFFFFFLTTFLSPIQTKKIGCERLQLVHSYQPVHKLFQYQGKGRFCQHQIFQPIDYNEVVWHLLTSSVFLVSPLNIQSIHMWKHI